MARPALKDVAALAHVSEPTVSRVLNGRTGVSSATRDRVIEALATLGFDQVPEPIAVRRRVVGIVCGDLLNPVFPTLLHHVSSALARRGHLTTVAVVDDNLSPEERCLREFKATGVDGIVLIGGRHAELGGDLAPYTRLLEAGGHLVLVNGTETGLPIPHVRCDEGVGATKAVGHLLGLGHKRIGCVLGSERFVPSRRMLDAYRRSLADAGLEYHPDDVLITPGFSLEESRAATNRLMKRGITGIVAGNDLMALGAIQAVESSGRSVPGDVSVVGYDGTPMTGLTKPALTTLRQPFEDMASLVADSIRTEIDGGTEFRDSFVFEPQLVVRESTGRCRPAQSSVSSVS